jgi:large subunit ribosomal protein L35
MPKMKTHSSAKKRFKVTGSGKISGRHANTRHRLRNRTKKNKLRLRRSQILSPGDANRVRLMLCI